MENEEMKKCPYCAELIRAEAIKCRYCGSNLATKTSTPGAISPPQYWQRVGEGKKIAGVCTGIARQFDSPILILPLRIFFLATAIFYGFGLILYIIMWILMPAPTDRPGKGGSQSAPPSDGETVPRQPMEQNPVPPEEPVTPGTTMQHRRIGVGTMVILGLLFFAFFANLLNIIYPSMTTIYLPPHLLGHNWLLQFSLSSLWRLLLVSGVVLALLAGVGIITFGFIPLALVMVGVIFLFHGGHGLPVFAIYAGLLVAAIVILWQGAKLFRSTSGVGCL